jgi:flavin-dependent dehydrogenase
VRRTTLHEAMRQTVVDAGVPIEERAVGHVRQDRHGVVVDGERVAFLVAADGLHSPLRRSLGLERRGGGPRRFGLRRHYRVPLWTSYVEVHWADAGEAYVTPVADDLVGVAVLTGERGGFDAHLAHFPALLERLSGAEVPGGDRGAGPLRQRASARVQGRVLLVGDAAGYVDALTGEGVALAVAQARAAVAALVDGVPERYERDWRSVTRRYRLLTDSLLRATRLGPVRRGLVPTAERLPGLFSAAVNTMAGPA